MADQKIEMVVTNKKVGYSYLKNYLSYERYGPPGTYPDGSAGIYGYQPDKLDTKLYLVPTYRMDLFVICTDSDGREEERRKVGEFEVVRFGIDNKTNTNGKDYGSVCGLKDKQSYTIKIWNGNYQLQSNHDAEAGAWVVFERYLVHDGSNYPRLKNDLYGASGCIEVCGPGEWQRLNAMILSLSCSNSLAEVASSRQLSIKYQPVADYPGLFTDKDKFMQMEFRGNEPLPFVPGNFDWGDLTCQTGQLCLCSCDLPDEPPTPPSLPGDPLIVDLDRNGITTVGTAFGIHFDNDGDGFRDLSGWVAPGDGFLMLDINDNSRLDSGQELFSDFTVSPNGTQASNGFQALQCYDSNGDGIIDAHDPVWTQLKVYHETEFEFSYLDLSGTISSLDELGITAIYLNSTISNRTDESGNTEVRSGLFEWADGTDGTIAEYRFQRDTLHTIPTELVEVPSEIEALPDLKGYGNVYSLHQAMARDSSGRLKSLVEIFASEENLTQRTAIMHQIILEWTGVASFPDQLTETQLSFISPFTDVRQIYALDKLYGKEPSLAAGKGYLLYGTYQEVFEIFYGNLMAQTHLKELYDKISYVLDEQTEEYQFDPSALIAALQEKLTTDPEKGKELLAEFARSRRGLGYFGQDCYLAFREAFIQMDPSLGWIFDTGGLPVYEHVGQGFRPWSPHIEGTPWNDAVLGNLTEGDGRINGADGNDVIYGSSRDESLYNGDGDSILVAGGGFRRIPGTPYIITEVGILDR